MRYVAYSVKYDFSPLSGLYISNSPFQYQVMNTHTHIHSQHKLPIKITSTDPHDHEEEDKVDNQNTYCRSFVYPIVGVWTPPRTIAQHRWVRSWHLKWLKFMFNDVCMLFTRKARSYFYCLTNGLTRRSVLTSTYFHIHFQLNSTDHELYWQLVS